MGEKLLEWLLKIMVMTTVISFLIYLVAYLLTQIWWILLILAILVISAIFGYRLWIERHW